MWWQRRQLLFLICVRWFFSFSRLDFDALPHVGLLCFAKGAVCFWQSCHRFTFTPGEPVAELLTLPPLPSVRCPSSTRKNAQPFLLCKLKSWLFWYFAVHRCARESCENWIWSSRSVTKSYFLYFAASGSVQAAGCVCLLARRASRQTHLRGFRRASRQTHSKCVCLLALTARKINLCFLVFSLNWNNLFLVSKEE